MRADKSGDKPRHDQHMVHESQVWNEEDAEDEVLAMVARTGLRTTVGNLLRQVMCPVHAVEPRKDTFVTVSVFHISKHFLCKLSGDCKDPLVWHICSVHHNVYIKDCHDAC